MQSADQNKTSGGNLLRIKHIFVLLVILLMLGSIYFTFGWADQNEPSQPKIFVWDIKDTDIERVVILLHRQGKSQAFIKIPQGDKFPWYFDDGQKSQVDANRWGGGIPLILSGPSADRIIANDANQEQLTNYGLAKPSMEITLTLANHETMKIDVGDSTPNGNNYYVRVQDSNTVATVDTSWYLALEGLVTNPPNVSP